MNDVNFRKLVEKIVVKWCNTCKGCYYYGDRRPLTKRVRKMDRIQYDKTESRDSAANRDFRRGFICYVKNRKRRVNGNYIVG